MLSSAVSTTLLVVTHAPSYYIRQRSCFSSRRDVLLLALFPGVPEHVGWSITPVTIRTAARNIVRIPHAKNNTRLLETEKDTFEILFDQSIIYIIVKYTNQEIALLRNAYQSNQRFLNDTDSSEILALIGRL
ncbi:hypothetical protein PR048_013437 [Dryococelus australis]|uniref:Uncharacterized protein n=1 Tax=Dryococelus australis TaxID=614101 RepID=A0ABQ9HS55_9NEOP|nr:hypothetical protein PR048_013437 [Dryococelus australis]